MKEYQFINTGKSVSLDRLIHSVDVQDKTIINIYDCNGKFITRGNWFQDNILEYTQMVGVASKVGTGLTISFIQCQQENERNSLERTKGDIRAALNTVAHCGEIVLIEDNYDAQDLKRLLRALDILAAEAERK